MQCDLARKAHASPTVTGCAARYVAQSSSKGSIDVIKRHVTLLQSYVGDLEPLQTPDRVNPGSLWEAPKAAKRS